MRRNTTHVLGRGERVHGLRPGTGLLADLRELEDAALRQVVVGVHALQQPLRALVQAQLLVAVVVKIGEGRENGGQDNAK